MIAVCPKCDVPLIGLLMHGVAIDMCHHCRGVWFDSGEIEMMLEALGTDLADGLPVLEPAKNPTTKNGKLLCPRCDRKLEAYQPVASIWGDSGLEIDRCPKSHGLFFDHSELEAFLSLNPERPGLAAAIDFLNDFFGTNMRKTNP